MNSLLVAVRRQSFAEIVFVAVAADQFNCGFFVPGCGRGGGGGGAPMIFNTAFDITSNNILTTN